MTFDQRVEIRFPKAICESVDAAAEQKITTRSEYARQAILEKLKADGFYPARRVEAA